MKSFLIKYVIIILVVGGIIGIIVEVVLIYSFILQRRVSPQTCVVSASISTNRDSIVIAKSLKLISQ